MGPLLELMLGRGASATEAAVRAWAREALQFHAAAQNMEEEPGGTGSVGGSGGGGMLKEDNGGPCDDRWEREDPVQDSAGQPLLRGAPYISFSGKMGRKKDGKEEGRSCNGSTTESLLDGGPDGGYQHEQSPCNSRGYRSRYHFYWKTAPTKQQACTLNRKCAAEHGQQYSSDNSYYQATSLEVESSEREEEEATVATTLPVADNSSSAKCKQEQQQRDFLFFSDPSFSTDHHQQNSMFLLCINSKL
mmetsp:Transcript_42544/g.73912  ORF Transcript_42544/g.73912 Transcript_42544/m.73912 type:complete len:247 (-) Transcript_42544:149-889(-)